MIYSNSLFINGYVFNQYSNKHSNQIGISLSFCMLALKIQMCVCIGLKFKKCTFTMYVF